MRLLAFFTGTLLGALLLISGCTSTSPGVRITEQNPPPKDSTEAATWQPKGAWVFVDGVQQGTTPATVTIRRSFEITNVSLHTGAKFNQVRRFEIERNISSSRRMLDFSFSGRISGGYITFNLQELQQDSKGNYIIPFFEQPLQIIDREYDLVLIIRE